MSLLARFFSSGGCLSCHSQEDTRHGICPQCQESMGLGPIQVSDSKAYLDGVHAIMEYRDLTRRLVWRMKFKEEAYLARIFAGFMGDLLEGDLDLREGASITYIPMARRKKAKRGYNQGEEIAKALAKNTGLDLIHALEKTREGKDQIGLSSRERFENVKSSFAPLMDLRGKKILLVDDIYTTGATLTEAARTLKKAGALEVVGLVIARADYIDPRKLPKGQVY